MSRREPLIAHRSVLCLAAAAAVTLSAAAHADSQTGVDSAVANALEVGVARAAPHTDLEAMEPQRSPVGRLYEWNYVPPADRRASANGWSYTASAEAGVLGTSGDVDHVLFRRYKDVDDGILLRRFDVAAERAADARYLSILGGSPGRDDQYYELLFGRYNAWKARVFLNEQPAYFTNSFRSLWQGVGTDTLTLNGLTPGGLATAPATQAAILGALAATRASTLSLTRTKAGARIDYRLGAAWKAFASFSNEERKGSRPYGMIFGGGGGGGNIEIPESIDYDTTDLLAGLQFVRGRDSLNLQVSASLFRNHIDVMTVQNPLTVTVNTLLGVLPGTFTAARFDLYPDNDFYKVKAEYARDLGGPWRARLTAAAAMTQSKQNDPLIAPTPYSLAGGTLNGVSAANVWNTTAALQRDHADTEIDTSLFTLGLLLHPTSALTVRADGRLYATDNSLEYTACNPLTGQWGRLINEGSGAALVNTPAYLAARCNEAAVRALNVAPSAGNINIASVPFEHSQRNWSLGADYRLGMASSVNARFEREELHRKHRERDRTWENRFKLGYTNRGLDWATLLVSWEYTDRGGSEYIVDPYEEFLSASLGPLPTAVGTNMAAWLHNIDSFRKFDLADRRQNIANARVNFTPTPSLDLALSGQYRDAKYPTSTYGRTASDQTSVTVEVNYQPWAELGAWSQYTWQTGSMNQRGLQANACLIGTTYYFFSNGAVATVATPPAGTTLVGSTAVTAANALAVCGTAGPLSPLYPTSRSWDNDQDDENHSFGAGLRYERGRARFDLSYTYLRGTTSTAYAYNASALALTAVQTALIGSGLPDQRIESSTVDASLDYALTSAASARLFARWERGRIRDWHYDGVLANPAPANNAIYLDSGPPYSYDAVMVGLFFRVRL